MHCPKAAIFDLDNTLADPHRPPSGRMMELLARLISRIPVAIMSAASLERIERDVLAGLYNGVDLHMLTLFTANAAQCFIFKEAEWRAQYRYSFSDSERAIIQTALEQATTEVGALAQRAPYGVQFVDYEGYLAFTALGVDAPAEERKKWDPDGAKRKEIRAILQKKIPQFDIFIGGLTTIDITLKGINKTFGVEWYANYLSCPPSDMLYVGDALYEGGNDAAVIPTGIRTISTTGPENTKEIIERVLAACSTS